MTDIEVGATLVTVEDYERCPYGTMITTSNGRTERTRTLAGWINNNGETYTSSTVVGEWGRGVVAKIGEPMEETIARYMQRLATTVVGAAHASSVNREPVFAALEALEVPTYPICVGSMLHPQDVERRNNLPAGSVVSVGVVDVWRHYGLFGWTGNRWNFITGGISSIYDVATVVSLGGGGVNDDEWMQGVATDEDREAIAHFKRRAWTLGVKAKQSAGWCGEYERAMERMGIDSSVGLLADPVANPITWTQALALPSSALIRWTNPDNANEFFIATRGESANALGERLAGTVEVTEHDGLEVLNDGDGPVRVAVPSDAFLRAVAVGSVISHSNHPYTKTAEDQWTARGGGTHRSRDFGTIPRDTWVTRFGPEVASLNGYSVGSVMPDDAAIASMPEGTTFTTPTQRVWTRIEGGGMRRDDGMVRSAGAYGFRPNRFTITSIPAEATQRARWVIGYAVADDTEVAALPVGAEVFADRNTNWWRKISANEWRHEGRGRTINNHGFTNAAREGRVLIKAMPGTAPSGFTVGQAILFDQRLTVPVGTVLAHSSNPERRYRLLENRIWAREGSGHTRHTNLANEGMGRRDYVIVSLPGEPVVEAEVLSSVTEHGLALGDQVPSAEVMDLLPAGTVVTLQGGGSRYTKLEGGNWSPGTARRNSYLASQFGFGPTDSPILAELPDVAPTFAVGQIIPDHATMDTLPVGTVVRYGTLEYTKTASTEQPWTSAHGARHRTSAFGFTLEMTIHSLPEVTVVAAVPRPMSEVTFEEFMELPVGSQITTAYAGGVTWTKRRNGDWNRGNGNVGARNWWHGDYYRADGTLIRIGEAEDTF